MRNPYAAEKAQESLGKRLVASALERIDALHLCILQAILRSLGVTPH